MNCHWCDTRLDESELICRTCGREVVRGADASLQTPPAARCYACDAPLEAGAATCASCGREVARAEPAPAAVQNPPDVPDPNHPALANVVLDPEPAPPPMCPRHAGRPSRKPCRRCGQFGCDLCIPNLSGNHGVCVDCIDRGEGVAARKRMSSLSRRMLWQTGVVAVAGAAIWFYGVAQGHLVGRSVPVELPLWGTAAITGALIAGALVTALLFHETDNRTWAWACVILQGAVAVSFFAYGVRFVGLLIIGLAYSRRALNQYGEDRELIAVIERGRAAGPQLTIR